MKSTKWYMFFNTSKLLNKDHKEFLETFDCEEHFSKWYINNFRHIVFGRKIVHFIDAVNISHKKHGASRLATFSYVPGAKRLNLWQEFKEAFPFWFSECVQKVKKSMEPATIKYQWVASSDNLVREIHNNSHVPIRFSASSQWHCRCSAIPVVNHGPSDIEDAQIDFWKCPSCNRHISDGSMKIFNIDVGCQTSTCRKSLADYVPVVSKAVEPPVGRDWPEPISMTPYYVVVLVLAALLILDGFLTKWGVVDYSQILK